MLFNSRAHRPVTRFAVSRPLLGLLAAFILSSTALAHGVTKGEIEIIHPHIPAPMAAAKSAGGFLGIANGGETADRLLGVEVGFFKQSMLHTTVHGADGVARMQHIDAIDIPAGETVLLERGGLHIMMMGPSGPLSEGQMLPATLIFEHAGRVEVEFSVDPPNAVDHSAMGH